MFTPLLLWTLSIWQFKDVLSSHSYTHKVHLLRSLCFHVFFDVLCFCVCVCVFLDLQLCKQLSQYCKDKLLLVALPLLKLYYWESASTDALSVSFSGYSLLVIFYLVCIFLTCTYFHKIGPQVGKNTIWAQWKSWCSVFVVVVYFRIFMKPEIVQ